MLGKSILAACIQLKIKFYTLVHIVDVDTVFILIPNTFLSFLKVNDIYQLSGIKTEQDRILGMFTIL